MTKLSLAVQYATEAPELPRWRIRRWVQRALEVAAEAFDPPIDTLILTIRIVGKEEGLALNSTFRGRDYATNVLTFNYDPMPGQDDVYQADIVLCHDVLVMEAQEQCKTYLNHAAHLCVHATLHALGFDHEEDQQAQEMEALETRILASMGVPDPYQEQ